MKKPKQKCIVLIDGSNFYFKLKDLGLQKLLEFDFLNFIKFLSNDEDVVKYVGFSHKPSVAMVANCSSSKLLTRHELEKFLSEKRK